jgi:hypothetical protein
MTLFEQAILWNAELEKMSDVDELVAIGAVVKILNEAHSGDLISQQKIAELLGLMATSDDVAKNRKGIVWQLNHGPCMKLRE